MTRLFLIRHGLTEWNKVKRYCGQRDMGLSKEGKSQASLLSKRLKAFSFDKIYCSNKKRAKQTAVILFEQSRIILKPDLREINFGVLEGLNYEENIEKCGEAYKKWLNDPFKNKIIKAEPMDAFKKRVDSAIWGIIRSNPGKTIAVVCHGGVISIFLNGILKSNNFWRCVPSSASLTMLEQKKGKLLLKKFNDTSHLKVKNE